MVGVLSKAKDLHRPNSLPRKAGNQKTIFRHITSSLPVRSGGAVGEANYSSKRTNVENSNNGVKIEMHLFILYNLQLEIINFLYKNFRKAVSWWQVYLKGPNVNKYCINKYKK